jgi:DNA-binding beta-propeller fold protein YncE
MRLTSHAARRTAAAAITCTAILLPSLAQAPAGSAATATHTAGRAIRVGKYPGAIAITPDGKTAYEVSGTGTVTPIRTATDKALKAIKVGDGPAAIVITPNGRTAYAANYIGPTGMPLGDTVTRSAWPRTMLSGRSRCGPAPAPSLLPRTGRPSTSPMPPRKP